MSPRIVHYTTTTISMVSLKWGDVLSTLLPGAVALVAIAPFFPLLHEQILNPSGLGLGAGVALLMASALAGGVLEAVNTGHVGALVAHQAVPAQGRRPWKAEDPARPGPLRTRRPRVLQVRHVLCEFCLGQRPATRQSPDARRLDPRHQHLGARAVRRHLAVRLTRSVDLLRQLSAHDLGRRRCSRTNRHRERGLGLRGLSGKHAPTTRPCLDDHFEHIPETFQVIGFE